MDPDEQAQIEVIIVLKQGMQVPRARLAPV
jgi:hypothetical protein